MDKKYLAISIFFIFFAIVNLIMVFAIAGYPTWLPILLFVLGIFVLILGAQKTKIANKEKKKPVIEEITKTEQASIDKLKRLVKVSDKIQIERMQKILNINEAAFNKYILDWAENFDLRIDGEYVVINKETVDDFISMLDKQFQTWTNKEQDRIGKQD